MPNHPIDLGEQLATSLRAYRSRIGSFLLITLLPYLASIVIFGIAALLGTLVMAGLVRRVILLGVPTFNTVFAPVVLFAVITIVAAALTGFFSLKSAGMQSVMTRLTIDHSNRANQANQVNQANQLNQSGAGPKPTFGDAWRGSAGFVVRILPLYLLLLAIVVVLSLLYVGISLAIILPSVGSTTPSGDLNFGRLYGAIVGVIAFSVVLEAVVAVISIIIATRLYPLVPVVALERASGFAALKRAWSLTKGYGVRTFGYLFVASLIPTGVVYAVAIIGALASSGMLSSSISLDSGSSPQVGPGLVLGLLLIYLPVIVAAVVVMPFLGIFQTVYTIDLQRRQQLGPRPGYPQPGYPQPGYPQPPYNRGTPPR